jgi:exoribonuclease-2
MFNLASGKIVLFFQDGNLQSGIITEAQNRHYKVLNQEAKTYILPPARFILVTQKVYEPASTKTLEDFEKQIKNKIEEEGENWLLQLQETQDSFTFAEICSKFGLEGDIERFALFILLQQRKDLFKFKKDVFSFRNEEERLKYLQEEAETRERTRYLKEVEKFLQTYQDLLPSLNILSPIKDDVSQGFGQDSKTQFLSELRELLRSNTPKDLAKLLHKYSNGLDLRTLIRNIRLLLGDISPDTDKIAADSGIPINFSSEILREAQKLHERLKQEAENQNVTNLEAFTIDAIDSPDYDDAISLQKQEQGWILGIHISDVGGQLPLNSSIFREACERVSSLYLPCETIPLLPPSLSKEAFSLKAGEKRKVLSLYLFMDKKEFKIEREVFKQEYITVKQNLSYAEVDRYLTSHQNSTLLQIVHHIHKGRQIFESGGKRRYEWNVVCKNGELTMECIDYYSPARLLIEELMVLYNRTLAEYAFAKGLSCIYRNIAQYEGEEGNSHNYCQAFLSTKAAFHPGIGSRAYLHCSSPIRRVTDIINQAQFEALLNQNRPPFSEEELIKLIPAIEERVSYLHSVAARSEHYWFLRFLQQKYLQRTLDAILIRSITDGYIIELTDWDKHIFLKSNEILPLHHSVKLILTEVNPDEDWVKGEIIV